MGETLRGAGHGDEGPLLNPSGMSLIQSYTIEADYLFAQPATTSIPACLDRRLDLAATRSRAAFTTPITPTIPSGAPAGARARGRAGAVVAVRRPTSRSAATGKYFMLAGDQTSLAGGTGGFTYDVGITAAAGAGVSLGVVGYNLRDLNVRVAPQAVGYGVALSPTDILLIAVDGRDQPDRRRTAAAQGDAGSRAAPSSSSARRSSCARAAGTTVHPEWVLHRGPVARSPRPARSTSACARTLIAARSSRTAPARHHPRRQLPPLRPAASSAQDPRRICRAPVRRVKLLRSMHDDGNFPSAGCPNGRGGNAPLGEGPVCAGPPTS